MTHADTSVGGGPLGVLDRALAVVEDLFNILAAITIFLVMIVTVVGIVARLSGSPIPGALDLTELSIAVFAFLGVAYAQRLAAHIRMDIVIMRFRGRLRAFVEALATLAGLLLVLVLIRYSWDFFLNAYNIGDTTPDAEIPTWPAKLVVPVAFTMWAIRLTLEFIGFVRLTIWPSAAPVAVPKVLTPAEEAAHEVESLREHQEGGR
ncbi:TRAP transporter small permease [Acuticoccus sp. I52.16.1]|uniref:TRAP transporter small permease n=1 Tax=Acuticoccus sp. I52.16.1 TaxID=2928472 RepID=UPI001FCFF9A5|nr:TRAP transporter small permease [Acuticoccus sp. I52.16.1]UOM34781.1 TRAP transporter small permease [Acuticoccus sp. I52.16.1]